LGGTVAWEEVHASPILDASGNLTHVVEVWRDISDRRAAEARLAESHRLASLGMLASGFSHELNTPLATVLTCVEGILREVSDASDARVDWPRISDNAAIAREQILRCRGITQHFLRLSRGKGSPGYVVDLGAAISTVVRLVEPTARAHSVNVVLVSIAPDLRVCADEAELQHALINLLLNAIQASKPGGRVLVSAAGARKAQRGPASMPGTRDPLVGAEAPFCASSSEAQRAAEQAPFCASSSEARTGPAGPPIGQQLANVQPRPSSVVRASSLERDSVRVQVTDEGCGIAPENLKRIFEPFFSLRKGGTGLGLFLSLNFVRRWSGDILVESATGKGSTFEIVLPAVGNGSPQEAAG
jgi:signal transduction histidine kinase